MPQRANTTCADFSGLLTEPRDCIAITQLFCSSSGVLESCAPLFLAMPRPCPCHRVGAAAMAELSSRARLQSSYSTCSVRSTRLDLHSVSALLSSRKTYQPPFYTADTTFLADRSWPGCPYLSVPSWRLAPSGQMRVEAPPAGPRGGWTAYLQDFDTTTT